MSCVGCISEQVGRQRATAKTRSRKREVRRRVGTVCNSCFIFLVKDNHIARLICLLELLKRRANLGRFFIGNWITIRRCELTPVWEYTVVTMVVLFGSRLSCRPRETRAKRNHSSSAAFDLAKTLWRLTLTTKTGLEQKNKF